MDILKSKATLKARCATYADELILSGMNTEQQRAALAGSISSMYAILKRRGFFSVDPLVTLLPATQAEIDVLEGYKTVWVGAAKIRGAQGIVLAEIDALVDTATFDVLVRFNAVLSTL